MRPVFCLLLAILLGATGARGQGAEPDAFTLSGFGTVGIVRSSERFADFTGTPNRYAGAGFSRTWSAEVDSLFAVQALYAPIPRLSLVLQVVSEQDHEHSFRPHVEWANIKYQVTPDFSVRAGRTVLPFFMVADSRKVNYANPWVRPPGELYGLVPVTNNDGIDASYRHVLGTATATFHVTAGRSDTKFPGHHLGLGSITAQARELGVVVATLEQGFALARFNFGRASITLPELGPLFHAFRQFGPDGQAIADRYDLDDSRLTVFGAAASYDPGPWFVMGEWGRADSRSVLGRRSAAYGTAGLRFGKVTPYATWARATSDNRSDPGLNAAALPASLALVATTLNESLIVLLARKVAQETVSVGTRWDFARKFAFTLQYEHIRIAPGSRGTRGNLQPGFTTGGRMRLFSASIDFVF